MYTLDKNMLPGAEQIDSLILGIDHIAIAVTDLDEAIRWYSTAYGFTLTGRQATRGKRSGMLSAIMQAGAVTVVLLQGTEPESQITRFLESSGPGVHHIAYAVADLDEAIRKVTEAGGVIDTPVMADEGIRQAFLARDAVTGIRVELVERRGGSITEHNMEQLFRSMEDTGLC